MNFKNLVPYISIFFLLISFTFIKQKKIKNDYSSENWCQYGGPNKNGKLNSTFYKDSVNILWKFKYQGGTPTPLIVHNDIVYFGTLSGEVYALNEKGKLYWKVKLPGKIKYSLAYHNNTLIVPTTSNVIYGLDSQNGETKWKYNLNSSAQFVHPIIDNGKVYITCYEKIVVLETETGSLLKEIEKATSNGFDHKPLFTKDAIYISSNRVCKYKKDTGELIWKSKIDYFYKFYKGGPYIHTDTLYFPTRGSMYGFNIHNGEETNMKYFSSQNGQGIVDNDEFYYTYSYDGHFSSSNYMKCERLNKSETVFSLSESGLSMSRGSISDIIMIGNYIYFYRNNQELNCVDKSTGELMYVEYLPSKDLLGTPIYSNGKLYVRSGEYETENDENIIFALE